VEKALSHPGRFKTVRDNLEVKEIITGHGEARARYVLVRNPEEAQRDKTRREETIKKLKLELARIGELNGVPHTRAVCNLIAHPLTAGTSRPTSGASPGSTGPRSRPRNGWTASTSCVHRMTLSPRKMWPSATNSCFKWRMPSAP